MRIYICIFYILFFTSFFFFLKVGNDLLSKIDHLHNQVKIDLLFEDNAVNNEWHQAFYKSFAVEHRNNYPLTVNG